MPGVPLACRLYAAYTPASLSGTAAPMESATGRELLRVLNRDRNSHELCADASTLRIVRERRPTDASGDIALLLDWAGQGAGDVPDPYTGDADGFEPVWTLVDDAAKRAVARLLHDADSGIIGP